ncbi:MAG: hypothetical protein ACREM8_04380, partial [Vulcanimicrobiaceae bacterium]
MIGQLVLLAMLGTAAAPLDLVDEAAQPIGGAVVTFVDRAGRTDVERSAADGSVGAATGFDPVSARIAAPGFVAITLDLASAADPVRLAHVLPIIARVQVATGSARNLHQLPVASSVLDSNAIASSAAPTSDALLRALPGFDRTRSNSAFTNYGQLRLSLSGAGN